MREVWLYRYIINDTNSPSAAALQKASFEKYQCERSINAQFTEKMFGLNYILDNQFYSDERIAVHIDSLNKVRNQIENSLMVYGDFFKKRGVTYMENIYGMPIFAQGKIESQIESGSQRPCNTQEEPEHKSVASQPRIAESTSFCEDTAEDLSIKIEEKSQDNESKEDLGSPKPNSTFENGISAELIEQIQTQMKSAKTQIDYLERLVHEKEVKLQHAEKDAIRSILTVLVDGRFGSPLNELYLIWKNENTPYQIQQTLSNLFSALKYLQISPTKEKLVGKEISLTPDDIGKYAPMNGEDLSFDDRIMVRYPGYRYSREPMIKPVIQKVEEEHE